MGAVAQCRLLLWSVLGFVWAAAPRRSLVPKAMASIQSMASPAHQAIDSSLLGSRCRCVMRSLSMVSDRTGDIDRLAAVCPSVFGWLAPVAGGREERESQRGIGWLGYHHASSNRSIDRMGMVSGHTIDLPSSINSFTTHKDKHSRQPPATRCRSLVSATPAIDSTHHTPHHHPILSSGVCWGGEA